MDALPGCLSGRVKAPATVNASKAIDGGVSSNKNASQQQRQSFTALAATVGQCLGDLMIIHYFNLDHLFTEITAVSRAAPRQRQL